MILPLCSPEVVGEHVREEYPHLVRFLGHEGTISRLAHVYDTTPKAVYHYLKGES